MGLKYCPYSKHCKHPLGNRSNSAPPLEAIRGQRTSLNEVCRLVLSFVDQESVSHLLLVNDLPYDSRDPKEFTEFTDYMESVAEFGFNHIIIIGEIDYGMVFMDCYSRCQRL